MSGYKQEFFQFNLDVDPFEPNNLASAEPAKLQEAKSEAIYHIKEAAKHIEQYADISKRNYKPQMMARTIHIDWDIFTQEVQNEVNLVGGI